MEKYIAFLRGINISGKNSVPMAELKECFTELGLSDVKTYLNSGNVVFSYASDDTQSLCNQIESAVEARFNAEIPVFIISQDDLSEILAHAPDWWGDDNKEIYDNLIFMLPPLNYSELFAQLGEPKAEYEKVFNYKCAVFWSFSRKDYRKTNWWSKTASAGVSKNITIRTANTVRKVSGV